MRAKDKRKGFIIFHDFRKILEQLPVDVIGKVMMAGLDYSERGDEPRMEELGALGYMAYTMIKLQIERGAVAYDEGQQKKIEAGKASAAARKRNREIAEAVRQGDFEKAKRLSEEADDAEPPPAVNECEQVLTGVNSSEQPSTGVEQVSTVLTNYNNKQLQDIKLQDNTHTIVKNTETPPSADGSGACATVSPRRVVDDYNSICPMLPEAEVTQERKAAIRDMVAAGYDLPKLQRLFMTVAASSFLTGGGASGWRASFDWIMQPKNAQKILEGNFADRSGDGVKSGRPKTRFHNFEERGTDYDALIYGMLGK